MVTGVKAMIAQNIKRPILHGQNSIFALQTRL
jgi:hypothetical protein